MNGKRAKALKKLSDVSTIGYRTMKTAYNTIARMSKDDERKLKKAKNENINNTSITE